VAGMLEARAPTIWKDLVHQRGGLGARRAAGGQGTFQRHLVRFPGITASPCCPPHPPAEVSTRPRLPKP
jgi:hypothetical protein